MYIGRAGPNNDNWENKKTFWLKSVSEKTKNILAEVCLWEKDGQMVFGWSNFHAQFGCAQNSIWSCIFAYFFCFVRLLPTDVNLLLTLGLDATDGSVGELAALPTLSPREKSPLPEAQRRIEPAMLHHTEQQSQRTTDWAILAPNKQTKLIGFLVAGLPGAWHSSMCQCLYWLAWCQLMWWDQTACKLELQLLSHCGSV